MRTGPFTARPIRRTSCGVLAVVLLGLGAAAGPAASADTAKPSRIASLNPCTDQLVWQLADHDRIVSLSHLAVDPQVSMIADELDVDHLNHGEAEEILPLNPDLVLNGPFAHRAATLLLRRLGYRVVEVGAATSFDDIRRQVREIGEILGEEERAEKALDRMDARLADVAAGTKGIRPSALNYQPNGFTAGEGTLVADVLRHAGFSLPGGDGAWRGYSHLPLERLIAHPPDVLIIDNSYGDWPTQSQRVLVHPVFKKLDRDTLRTGIPNRMWLCGIPDIVQAVERLAEIRAAWIAWQGKAP